MMNGFQRRLKSLHPSRRTISLLWAWSEMAGKVVTFYSYKGGVRRSMAVANVGVLLAQWGYKVLLVDFDLEAPGLENYFETFSESRDLRKEPGIVEFLSGYLKTTNSADIKGKEIRPLKIKLPRSRNALDLWTSGKRDEGYFRRVRQLDFPELYVKADGGKRSKP
jgi:Mrp family chromosome partitioning ATPase